MHSPTSHWRRTLGSAMESRSPQGAAMNPIVRPWWRPACLLPATVESHSSVASSPDRRLQDDFDTCVTGCGFQVQIDDVARKPRLGSERFDFDAVLPQKPYRLLNQAR